MEISRSTDKYRIIFFGLLVHVILLFAVFDVYFASPLDHGMTSVKSTDTPTAKRLVLFVADGLRAESVFDQETEERIPFLSNILRKKGSWGVAHTRVPTESRPGHVALLAGIYEDPSAILKGWKANPVYFDSVINQSKNAWCWGSPDIVNIFNRDNLSKIHLDVYESEIEDFGKEDTGILDVWVFDKVEQFFKNTVKKCNESCEQYFEQGNIFFLHLLGIDTAGHGYKPHSKEYINNIKLVDVNIKKTVTLVESIFQDNATTYIFTADHGMTDWGSHGAGSVHETEVPLIIWGAGIKQNIMRQDINQIDTAPLLSSLIGINIPINSLGIIPTQYLNVDQENLAKIIMANTEQLLRIYNVKQLRIQNNALANIPFKTLDNVEVSDKMIHLKQLQSNKEFDKMISLGKYFMTDLIQGIKYYHNYYQYPILISVSFGFLVWILILINTVFLLKDSTFRVSRNEIDKNQHGIFIVILLIVIFLCFKSNFSFSYFVYFLFPVVAFWLFLESSGVSIISSINCKISDIYLHFILYFVGIELLVYGFFDRRAYSALMVLVSGFVSISHKIKQIITVKEIIFWIGLCLSLAVFPMLPVMKTSFNLLLYSSGYLGWILMFIKIYTEDKNFYNGVQEYNRRFNALLVQFCCLHIAAIYVILLEYEYISNESSIKYISWFILLVPICLIPSSSKFIAIRLEATFFGFAPFYLLVSTNYEILFSVFYVSALSSWLFIEMKSFNSKNNYTLVYFTKFENYKTANEISTDNFRRAFLFTVFIFLGFFGTGNIASLNSFDPMWVRAFLTVFSPFKMTGLIILKLMVPFIFTCCVFRAINAIGKENVLNMFCIILIFSDLMVLQFMFLITNEGSWLDIGTSLSHFLIMEGFVTILLLLYGVAYWITSVSYVTY